MAALAAPMLIFIVFLVIIKIHQHEAYKRLEEQQLVCLVIPESEFRWHKTGKEILVDNRHFDCKEVKKLADRYYVTGVFDSEEDLLEQELEGTARQSAESAWLTEDAMFLVLFSDAHDFQVDHPGIIVDKNPPPLFADDYTSICTEPLSPPPNWFS